MVTRAQMYEALRTGREPSSVSSHDIVAIDERSNTPTGTTTPVSEVPQPPPAPSPSPYPPPPPAPSAPGSPTSLYREVTADDFAFGLGRSFLRDMRENPAFLMNARSSYVPGGKGFVERGKIVSDNPDISPVTLHFMWNPNSVVQSYQSAAPITDASGNESALLDSANLSFDLIFDRTIEKARGLHNGYGALVDLVVWDRLFGVLDSNNFQKNPIIVKLGPYLWAKGVPTSASLLASVFASDMTPTRIETNISILTQFVSGESVSSAFATPTQDGSQMDTNREVEVAKEKLYEVLASMFGGS